MVMAGYGPDLLEGGDGNDLLTYADSRAGVSVRMSETLSDPFAGTGGDAAGDTVHGFEVLVGSQYADMLIGDSHDNILDGRNEVTILGRPDADDSLNGLAGNDTLYGGKGDDSLAGDEGDDSLNAGNGNDLLAGGNGADRLFGSDGDDTIDAGNGNDVLRGNDGDDSLNGGAGEDRLAGDTGADSLYGAGSNDQLQGNDGDDLLSGGSGDDVLDGGNGIDRLFGGDGNDRLIFGGSDDDHEGGSGVDVLQIAGSVNFTGMAEKTGSIEMLDMRDGASGALTLNAADILAFDGRTGETVGGSDLDLVIRGDSGGSVPDAVTLQSSGTAHFALQESGVALSDPVYGGVETLYDVYSDGSHQVAIEQGVTANS
jgi:Ca2+-binding RTX toxin-like protein